MHLKNQKGFTLIELLVTFAVLSILVLLALFVINPTKQIADARDAQRKKDLHQISVSLLSYYGRHFYYPVILSDLVGPDLKTEPKDPKTNSSYQIVVPGEGMPPQDAVIYTTLESPTDANNYYWVYKTACGRAKGESRTVNLTDDYYINNCTW